jgi:ABC-2 type transport system ATP-binding protein
MRMIAGYLEPDEGAAKIFNIDVAQDRRRAQERVGYLPEGAPLYGEMTPWSFLRFVAETRGMTREAARHAVIGQRTRRALGDTIDRPIETLSKGYRRRVGLAAALLHDPMLLILDEPTDGLDPNQRQCRARSDQASGRRAGAHLCRRTAWKRSKRSAPARSSSIRAASSLPTSRRTR